MINAFRKLTPNTIPDDKQSLSLEVSEQIKAFEASGGKIQQIPSGLSADSYPNLGMMSQSQMEKARKKGNAVRAGK